MGALKRWVAAPGTCAGRLRETGEVYDDLPDDVPGATLVDLLADVAPVAPQPADPAPESASRPLRRASED